MSFKREWERTTRASIALAVAHSIVRAVESNVEEPDYEAIRVRIPFDISRAIEAEVLDVEVYIPGILELRESYTLSNGLLVNVASGDAFNGVKLKDLMRRLPAIAWKLDGPEIASLASETSRSGVEYMVIYFYDGISLWLEGDVHRVTLPGIKNAVGAIHTHPEGSCALSRADVLSSLDLMIEGGIFEGAATEKCMFYIVRFSLLTENDYIKLLNVKDGLWEPETLESVETGVLY